jgi:hypothetical protein
MINLLIAGFYIIVLHKLILKHPNFLNIFSIFVDLIRCHTKYLLIGFMYMYLLGLLFYT